MPVSYIFHILYYPYGLTVRTLNFRKGRNGSNLTGGGEIDIVGCIRISVDLAVNEALIIISDERHTDHITP